MPRNLLAVFLLAGTIAPAVAQDVEAERFTLDNGLTVILHEDHALPQVVINVWYHVGAKDEPPGRSGFAHLFEHLMFRGTTRVPDGEFDRIMEAGGGYNNASTSKDRTNYYGQGPAELLPTLLWLEADRMGGLVITQDILDAERDVVRNERRQNYEDRPYGPSELLESSLCYPPEHPYHRTVIGSHADLEAAQLSDVTEFFDAFYVPNNASLVVAGDFDPEVVRPLVERYFGSVPRGDDVRPTEPAPAKLEGRAVHTVVDRVPYARTSLIWHSPAFLTEGDAAMDLVATLLADGITSRLQQALVVRDALAHDVAAAQYSAGLGSLFQITATAREGVALADIEAAIERELGEFVSAGIPEDDLARARTGFEASTLRGLESLARRADRLNLYQFHWGEPNGFARDLDRYRNATPESCGRWAREVLGAGRVVLRVLPEPEETAGASPLDAPPPVLPAATFAPPVPERFVLSNGVAVELWSRPELPLLELALLLPAGSAIDPAGREGVASMTAAMLDEGAGERDAKAFAAELERLGARFSSSVDRESTQLWLSALERNLEPSLRLFGEAVLAPRFLESEWERVQREAVAARRLAAENPNAIASLAGQALWFGRDHAYGRPAAGTPESLATIDLNDLVQFFADTYRPEGARLFVAGDVERAELERLLEEALGGWRGLLTPSGQFAVKPIGPPAGDPPRFAIVDRPGSSQTVVRVTWPGVSHDAPERRAHELLATVLGGTFTSRLNQNLRAEKGITYGASTALVLRPSAATNLVSTSVQAPATAVAVGEIRRELERLAAGGVSDEEARKARAALRQAAVESFAGLAGVIRTAVRRAGFGEGVEAVEQELAALPGFDAATLDEAAKSYVDLDGARWVLVGDGETIVAALTALGEDDYLFVDPEGRPVAEVDPVSEQGGGEGEDDDR